MLLPAVGNWTLKEVSTSFTSKHFGFQVTWRVCGFQFCGVAARSNGRKNLCEMS